MKTAPKNTYLIKFFIYKNGSVSMYVKNKMIRLIYSKIFFSSTISFTPKISFCSTS